MISTSVQSYFLSGQTMSSLLLFVIWWNISFFLLYGLIINCPVFKLPTED